MWTKTWIEETKMIVAPERTSTEENTRKIADPNIQYIDLIQIPEVVISQPNVSRLSKTNLVESRRKQWWTSTPAPTRTEARNFVHMEFPSAISRICYWSCPFATRCLSPTRSPRFSLLVLLRRTVNPGLTVNRMATGRWKLNPWRPLKL